MTHAIHRHLLLLPSLGSLWQRISIGIITNLLKILKTSYDCILVVINHFTKINYFVPCKKSLNTKQTVNLLIDMVIKYYRLPLIIVLDRKKY